LLRRLRCSSCLHLTKLNKKIWYIKVRIPRLFSSNAQPRLTASTSYNPLHYTRNNVSAPRLQSAWVSVVTVADKKNFQSALSRLAVDQSIKINPLFLPISRVI